MKLNPDEQKRYEELKNKDQASMTDEERTEMQGFEDRDTVENAGKPK